MILWYNIYKSEQYRYTKLNSYPGLISDNHNYQYASSYTFQLVIDHNSSLNINIKLLYKIGFCDFK